MEGLMVFIFFKLQVTYLCERLFCCFRRSSDDDDSHIRYESYSQSRGPSSVDPETRRQLQAEAAERRLAESSTRGIADPESGNQIINYSGMSINCSVRSRINSFHQRSEAFV
ncbi:unnamed protein product [Trichobilharzia szidati]|nr:unnamed protein product [Trichobilharzia szidati]